MKNANYFFLLIVVLLSSCSTTKEETPIDTTATFDFSVNGTPMALTIKSAYKKAHTIRIGNGMVSFDENGHFGKITFNYSDPSNGVTKNFTSYRDFSSNYFNFQMISYDEVNKRVKGTFYGNVYKDPSNLNSEGKFISGTFNLPCENYVAPIIDLGNESTINGVTWRATNMYQQRPPSDFHKLTLHSVSDDAYKVMFTINDANLPLGVYDFTSASLLNKVQIAKYNPLTSTYTVYNCTGSMTIINKWLNIVQGTYHLTGINPTDSSDIITVENGVFKLDYQPFN